MIENANFWDNEKTVAEVRSRRKRRRSHPTGFDFNDIHREEREHQRDWDPF